jgi:Family of unknown function (DUF6384)
MTASTAPTSKLDDLMLAMDVVDTIRHKEDVLQRELALGDRDEELIERLREIYTGQGITVTDEVLKEGVKALKEQRFQYKAPPGGLLTGLFGLWIRRGALGKWLAALLVALGLGWYANTAGWFNPDQKRAEQDQAELQQLLPETFRKDLAATRAAAKDPAVEPRIAAIETAGNAGLREKNAGDVRRAIAQLAELRTQLDLQYDLVIVSRPGEYSRVFRIPNDQRSARNYYIIDPSGKVLTVPVKSEENQTTRNVTKFAIRVPKATYDAIGSDKDQDGIVQDNLLGRKQAGYLKETYLKPADGGMITDW